jgi:hypothetical protein
MSINNKLPISGGAAPALVTIPSNQPRNISNAPKPTATLCAARSC